MKPHCSFRASGLGLNQRSGMLPRARPVLCSLHSPSTRCCPRATDRTPQTTSSTMSASRRSCEPRRRRATRSTESRSETCSGSSFSACVVWFERRHSCHLGRRCAYWRPWNCHWPVAFIEAFVASSRQLSSSLWLSHADRILFNFRRPLASWSNWLYSRPCSQRRCISFGFNHC